MEKKFIINPQNELQHHGIKGQKWGVRRFQNEDGSLTDAGKARYNEKGEAYKDPRDMSDKQLNDANKRLGAESQYRQLTGTTQPGKALNRDTAIKIGSTFLATGAATFLLRKYKDGKWLGKGEGSTKKKIGSAIVTALLAGSIGALLAGASSLGGSARPEQK
jgi:hypothetical protein